MEITAVNPYPSPPNPPQPPGVWHPGWLYEARWPNAVPVDAANSTGWAGWPDPSLQSSVSSCGMMGAMLGGLGLPRVQRAGQDAGGGMIGAHFYRTFDNLPIHGTLRIQFLFTKIDIWGDGNPLLLVDGVEAWGTGSLTATTSLDGCGEAHGGDQQYAVDVIIPHSADSATINITATVTRSGWWHGAPGWGFNDFRFTTALSHPSPPAPPAAPGAWHNPPIYHDIWPGATGWTGTSLRMTTCGRFGTMLGGYRVLDAGAASFVEKTFHNLPPHGTLRVQATYTRVDRLAAGLMYVDGGNVWRRAFNYMEGGSASECGTGGHSLNNEIQDLADVTVGHSADSVTIRFEGEGGASTWFGVQDVVLTTGISHPSPPAPPSPPGVWASEGWLYTASWPSAVPGWPGATGWEGWPDPNLQSSVSTCGMMGTMLGGLGLPRGPNSDGGMIGAYFYRTFDNLPSHSTLRVQFLFTKIDIWANGHPLLFVDGAEAWGSGTLTATTSLDGCGEAQGGDVQYAVDVVVPHSAGSVTINITATVTTSGWWHGAPGWGIQDFKLNAAVPHPSPPAPPSPPGIWTDAPVAQDVWPGATGWTGTSLVVSSCGQFGTMLGGYQRLGPSAYVEKTFTGLPPHTMLQIQLTFTRVDRLEIGLIYVDSGMAWRRAFNYLESGSMHACGDGGHSLNNEIQDQVDVNVAHSSENVTIRATAEGNGGYFGIQGVTILTGVWYPSPPAPPSPPGTWLPPVLNDRWPGATGWTGTSLAVTTCGHLGTMLGGYGVLNGASAYVEKVITGLPAHSTLRIQLTYTRVDHLGAGVISVDGVQAWRRTFSYVESGAIHACGSGGASLNNEVQVLADVSVAHSGSSATIRVAAEESAARYTAYFGIQNVVVSMAS